MVYLRFLPEAALDADGLAGAITEWQIKVHAVAKRRMRLVLHYWIDDRAVQKVIEAFRQIMGGNA
jgi:hypothetical protein